MGLNQTKKLLHNKEINAIKRQPTDWEKKSANHTYDKELIFKIKKELKSNTPPKKNLY
jgi:hypothetical protein